MEWDDEQDPGSGPPVDLRSASCSGLAVRQRGELNPGAGVHASEKRLICASLT